MYEALLAVLCRPSTLGLATLSSHIDKALDLVLLNYAGDVDAAYKHHFVCL